MIVHKNLMIRVMEERDVQWVYQKLQVLNQYNFLSYNLMRFKNEFIDKMQNDSKKYIIYYREEEWGLIDILDVNWIHRRLRFDIILWHHHLEDWTIGADILKRWIEYLYKVYQLKRIELLVSQTEGCKIEICQNAGLEKEAVFKDFYYYDGEYHNAYLFVSIQK